MIATCSDSKTQVLTASNVKNRNPGFPPGFLRIWFAQFVFSREFAGNPIDESIHRHQSRVFMKSTGHSVAARLLAIDVTACASSAAEDQSDAVLTAYEQGDYREALRRARPLAEQGSPKEQSILGVMYENGRGVPQDPVEAVRWFRKAAEQGHAQARINVGMTYFKGMGVPQDYVQAHLWFNVAAATATDDATHNLAVTNREAVAAVMTPAQVADAQNLAREWKPGR